MLFMYYLFNKKRNEQILDFSTQIHPGGKSVDLPKRRGFTLVEMIVSLAIFSIVSVVALGSLVKIVSANKKAQTLQASISNINFAIDSMSRELRTGNYYLCESNSGNPNYEGDNMDDVRECPSGPAVDENNGTVLAFRASKTLTTGVGSPCPAAYAYRFEPSDDDYVLQKAVQSSCDDSIAEDDFQNVIDDNVVISGYYVSVIDDSYPLVTVRISGYAGLKERERTYFDIQTTVGPRIEQ